MSQYAKERAAAVEVVLKACELAQQVQAKLVTEDTIAKKDNSPVTIGDYATQAFIIHVLTKQFPEYPFVAEENTKELKEDPTMVNKVLQHVKSAVPGITEHEVLTAIDRGDAKGNAKIWWTLDPIDGTQGFLRRDQYAICLALMVNDQPVIGVLGCPELPISLKDKNSPKGCCLIGVKGQGAFIRSLKDPKETRISVSTNQDPTQAIFTESYVSRGFAQELNQKITHELGVKAEPVRIDSQCKYAIVARGESDIYLRLSSLDYKERIWDHAAGVCIVTEAGGTVCDFKGRPLDFSLGRTLDSAVGIVCTNTHLHKRVMDAITVVDPLEISKL